MTRPRLLVVGGPTAIGKTDFAIQLAVRLGGEIVNADSRQVYRGMDIGTAKPTSAEREAVSHHMLDVATPDESFTLALYLRGARAAIASVHARSRLPILVGGTGLYLRALTLGYDVPEVPPNPRFRAELERMTREDGIETVVERLRALDPAVADRIDTRNPRRVIRALEVREALGVPAFRAPRQSPSYDVLMIILEMNREALFARAAKRLAHMRDEGFVDEVERLMSAGYGLDLPSMSALGYRELGRHVMGEIDLATAMAATESSTRAFIRRQLTWFRADTGARRVSVEQPRFLDEALHYIAAWCDSPCA